MAGAKMALAFLVLTGSGSVVFAQLPGVSIGDKMNTWSAAAICGFLALSAMALLAYFIKGMFRTEEKRTESREKLATSITELAETQRRTNALITEQIVKQGKTNDQFAVLNTELRTRKCMISKE